MRQSHLLAADEGCTSQSLPFLPTQADGEWLQLPPPFALITFSLLATHWLVSSIDLEIGPAWRLITLLGLLLGEASEAVCLRSAWARLWGSSKQQNAEDWVFGAIKEAHWEGEEKKSVGPRRDHNEVDLSWNP